MNLTDAQVRAAMRRGEAITLTDGNGRGSGRLLLRIRPPETAEWYCQRFEGGKRRLSKLGNFPAVTLSEARNLMRGAPEKVTDLKPVGTVGDLFEEYRQHLISQEKRSADNVGDTLRRLADALGKDRPANEITSADVVEVLRDVYMRGKVAMADHMRSYVRSAYGWVIRAQNDYRSKVQDKYRIEVNPAANIPTEPKVPGERYLNTEELSAFWWWLVKGGDPNPNRNTAVANLRALQLLCLTGQRVEEVARIHASMVNRRECLIDWPETKNGRAHVLPLAPLAWGLMTALPANEHGLLLPSDNFPDRPVSDQVLRNQTKRFCERTGCAYFTPRDLRRTWKTLAGIAGISKTDRDLLQNHVTGDVSAKHYDRYDYLQEKRAAMARWEDWFRMEVVRLK